MWRWRNPIARERPGRSRRGSSMPKLPAAMLRKAKKAMPSGKVPENGEQGYDEFYDLVGELSMAFNGSWERPKAGAAVRQVSALVDLWSAIPADGLLVGVAVNQP